MGMIAPLLGALVALAAIGAPRRLSAAELVPLCGALAFRFPPERKSFKTVGQKQSDESHPRGLWCRGLSTQLRGSLP